ncbi:hypothetical protein PR202_ga00147 [Eleusine coracana subsp. coracana]|uniref:Protein kinase domain-containing protein n=1 Tax=Eleusine coracana subsp. coracana TaxID=191504 RepID=A0AAV5BFQ3_ELECO|nr:hypothetical protein PR202_ga00147 [Eleusine coracana subsp. coracana]
MGKSTSWTAIFGGLGCFSYFHADRSGDPSKNNNTPMPLPSPEDLSLSLAGLTPDVMAFTVDQLRAATRDFSMSNFVGEGGFGPVYKGRVDERIKPGVRKPQAVAVKLLDLEGSQGHKEWLIAIGAAKGLIFLHEAAKPVIYRDFKTSNILLDSDYTAKLSDFGLAKAGPGEDETHVSTRVMGTQGYAAPEYVMTGHLTTKSDVYSFGVVLLEVLTGRKAIDKNRPPREQNLVDWARPCLRDSRRLDRAMDRRLNGQYSTRAALKAGAIAYRCLNVSPKSRPQMSAVVEALESLLVLDDTFVEPFVYTAPRENK